MSHHFIQYTQSWWVRHHKGELDSKLAWGGNALVRQGGKCQSTFCLSDHIGTSNCIDMSPKNVSYILITLFIVWSHHDTWQSFWYPILTTSPCHIPLKYRCMIKKSDNIGPHGLDQHWVGILEENTETIHVKLTNLSTSLDEQSKKKNHNGNHNFLTSVLYHQKGLNLWSWKWKLFL